MDKITILIADDHTLFRRGIRKMLEDEEDLVVVAEAANGAEALQLVHEHVPDVVLMDIQMPEMDGIEVTRILHREMPHLGIVFVTMYEDDEFVFRGLQAGGRGYILKDADPDTMLRAIRAVAKGESLLGPTIALKVMRQFSGMEKGNEVVVDKLTPREIEVLKQIAEGLSNREIGLRLSISEKTVKNHINNILSKLHLYDRTQATLYAIRSGIVKV
jgi:two-component system, NarL family, response regulator LiaR